MQTYIKILSITFICVLASVFSSQTFAQSVQVTATPTQGASVPEFTRFIVNKDDTLDTVADKLVSAQLVTSRDVFLIQWNKNKSRAKLPITIGAYKVPAKTNVAKLVTILRKPPYMKWIVIPPGLRKEEIGELLGRELGWPTSELKKWNTTYTALKYDYREGVYFPDTYLIPVTEKPIDVAKRLQAKFNEKFAPYQTQFTAKNIPWTKGLTMASLIQREAASIDEMPLIAGIMYNRIDQKIPLGIDATLQYMRGNKGSGWWAPLTKDDLVLKKSDSKYNTYKSLGMTPAPINSPSIQAIAAALNPATTDCLYYLHDKQRQIHCTVTYEEHRANIEKHLKTSTQ